MESEQLIPHGFNKGHSSKFHVGFQVQQTPEEGWRTYQPKYCGNNNKDEDNSPKTLNDKNHQASSQKFRQLIGISLMFCWYHVVRLSSAWVDCIHVLHNYPPPGLSCVFDQRR